MMNGIERIESALRRPGRPALVSYLTGGFPDPRHFESVLEQVAEVSDVVEIGVPFSDPMADGVTLQDAAETALKAGANLPDLLGSVERAQTRTPILLMSYLNPLMAYGLDRLAVDAAKAGVCGFIVPDLPPEEKGIFSGACEAAGLALITLVTPLTPEARIRKITADAQGFVYAVTRTGVTGGGTNTADILPYLSSIRAAAKAPVCAGFGIRSREDVEPLIGHVDGVIVGTALVARIARGEDPRPFLRSLVKG